MLTILATFEIVKGAWKGQFSEPPRSGTDIETKWTGGVRAYMTGTAPKGKARNWKVLHSARKQSSALFLELTTYLNEVPKVRKRFKTLLEEIYECYPKIDVGVHINNNKNQDLDTFSENLWNKQTHFEKLQRELHVDMAQCLRFQAELKIADKTHDADTFGSKERKQRYYWYYDELLEEILKYVYKKIKNNKKHPNAAKAWIMTLKYFALRFVVFLQRTKVDQSDEARVFVQEITSEACVMLRVNGLGVEVKAEANHAKLATVRLEQFINRMPVDMLPGCPKIFQYFGKLLFSWNYIPDPSISEAKSGRQTQNCKFTKGCNCKALGRWFKDVKYAEQQLEPHNHATETAARFQRVIHEQNRRIHLDQTATPGTLPPGHTLKRPTKRANNNNMTSTLLAQLEARKQKKTAIGKMNNRLRNLLKFGRRT